MKTKIYHVLCVLFALLLINSGFNKFFNYLPMPADMPEAILKDTQAMMEIQWLMPLIACAEIIGGILIIIPRTRALGALVVFPVMVGILLTHLLVAPSGIPMVLILWAVLVWIIVENRERYLALIR